jgi:hypothetical protein
VDEDIKAMREALAQDDATIYERGVTTLGWFLGAEADRATGDALTRAGLSDQPDDLVGDDELRSHGERPGDADPLALSAAERTRAAAHPIPTG